MTDEINFFSESDMVAGRDGEKRVASEYPLWYNRQMLDELQEDIRMAEFDIKSGRIKDTQLAQARERVNKLKERMTEVEASMPVLDAKGTDKLAKVRKELGKEISSRMYSRSDMKKGLADSHEEARRMSIPSIPLSPEASDIARACNITVRDGKINRTDAEKIWKISGRFLGEQSNAEALRRD